MRIAAALRSTPVRAMRLGPFGAVDRRLTGGPSESAAAEQVEVQVGNGLAAVAADVRHDAIAVAQPLGLRQAANYQEKMADERPVDIFDVVDRHDFLFRNDQDVRGRLWLDVAERQAVFVFVENLGGNLAIDDPLENGFSAHRNISVKKDRSGRVGRADNPARSVLSPELGSMGPRPIRLPSPVGSPASSPPETLGLTSARSRFISGPCRPPRTRGLFMILPGAVLLLLFASATSAVAQDVYVEQNGVLFREQRYVERRPVTSWQWEERPEVVYREEFVTTFREDWRTIQVPVTVANPNGGPPLQRWETRSQIVRSPVVTRQLVPETRTVRVPVRKLGFVGEERIARVPLGPTPNSVAYPPAGMPNAAGWPGVPGGYPGGPAVPPPQTARRPWKGMAVSGFDPTLNRW